VQKAPRRLRLAGEQQQRPLLSGVPVQVVHERLGRVYSKRLGRLNVPTLESIRGSP